MKAILNVTRLSVESMMLRPEQAYNSPVWKSAVSRYAEYPRCQFYVIEPDALYSYARFFVSYVAVDIYFFNDFSAFSACLSNNGFCKIKIDADGNVYKELFSDGNGKEGYADNSRSNREYFKTLSKFDRMVCSCL